MVLYAIIMLVRIYIISFNLAYAISSYNFESP